MVSERTQEQTMELVKERITGAGLRPTVQRIAIYMYLMENHVHPTADMIYQALQQQYPTFSRATVYNTVHALAEAGLIRYVNIEAQEQRFDGNSLDHGHFRCIQCGKIYDFPLDSQKTSVLCPDGFSATVTDVFISGTCEACK